MRCLTRRSVVAAFLAALAALNSATADEGTPPSVPPTPAAVSAPATPTAPEPASWTKHFKAGAGIRATFRAQEHASPDGEEYSKEIDLEDARVYLSGKVNDHISGTLNVNTDGSEVDLLDGIAEFRLRDELNVWCGRMLPPTDRSNLDGPYYLATWDFPYVSNYPAIHAGRDDGLTVWGDLQGGRFKYSVGAFQGRAELPNSVDSLLYAGRLAVNLLDPEPGYYMQSTYYGEKDLLSIGVVAQYQNNGAGTATQSGDFVGADLDLLFEKKLAGGGVVTAEAAFYHYALEGVDLDGAASDAAGLVDSDGYMLQVGYLLPCKVGWGKFQPHLRWQDLNDRQRLDVGVNYVIKGHDARLSLIYYHEWNDRVPAGGKDTAHGFLLGAQLQF
ncbi:MAG: hypothetical protein HZA54_17465 [Planctomycetes bacterium]|nr:hypothetical protein [Planctomycetota bacterium]